MSVKRVRLTKIKPAPDADEARKARRRERERQYAARNTKRPPAERDQTAMRTCLHCSATFKSWGPGNRICGYCKTLSLFSGNSEAEDEFSNVRGNAKRARRVAAIAAKAFAT